MSELLLMQFFKIYKLSQPRKKSRRDDEHKKNILKYECNNGVVTIVFGKL